VVLKWFYSPRAVGTTLSEVHALYRVPFYFVCEKVSYVSVAFRAIIIYKRHCSMGSPDSSKLTDCLIENSQKIKGQG